MAGAVCDGSVESIFDDLLYGSALDGDTVARAWLEKNNRIFGHFINGQWQRPEGRETVESLKPATGESLATTLNAVQDDIDVAVASSRQAFTSWSSLSGHVRARYLYSIARNLQKHQSLLAVVEALDSGKPSRETRGVDIPAVIRHVYHHAGWAQLLDGELAGFKPIGVTAVVTHWTFPLLQLARFVSPALATGNTVVIMPSTHTRLSALLFAEICSQAGLPEGVINVVTGVSLDLLAAHADVDKLAFCGSVNDGQAVRKLTAGTGKSLSLELTGRCPVLVFEEADMDSTVEGIVEAAFFNSGQSNHAGSRLLVQEPIYTPLLKKLKARMSKLTIGDNMDKNNDQGALASPSAVQQFTQLISRAESEGAEVFRACPIPANKPNCIPPVLIENVQTSSPVYLDEVAGPLIVAIPFRTVKESVALANHSVFGTAASVWTENISVATEVASLLQCGTVWINSHNLQDAAAGVGGCKQSGFGRSGGKEGLFEFVQPNWRSRPPPVTAEVDLKKFGAASNSDLLPTAHISSASEESPSIDKTYKLFYGGGQKRPDSGASRPVLGADGKVLGHVPDGGRKDVRNAVEAAVKAAPGWGRKEGHGKAQIMYYIAENLQSRDREVASLLSAMTGQTEAEANEEVNLAVQRLFYWAAYCDKYGGSIQETTLYGLTAKRHEPVGVIGIVCPDDFPFLGFISLVAPAVARGNAVVVVPSEKYPLAALGFHQVLETSDLPAGVINIITGDSDAITRPLAEHHDVDSLWYFRSAAGSKFVEAAAAGNLKRTWVNYGVDRDFKSTDQGQGQEWLYQATRCKNVWIPMGDIFAN